MLPCRAGLFPALFLAWPVAAQEEEKAPDGVTPFVHRAGESLAFVGDETVCDGRWCQYVENYFFTRFPDRKLYFHHAGLKMDTAGEVLARFDADPGERKPDYVIIQLGTWDEGLAGFDPGRVRVFQRNMEELLRRFEDFGTEPFLMSPPLVDMQVHRERVAADPSYRFRLTRLAPDYNGVMAYCAAWLGELAWERRLRFFDAWGALAAATARERRVNPAFSLMPEGLLADAGGHAVMAATVIEGLAAEGAGKGSEVFLTRGEGEAGWRSQVSGGGLTQLEGSDSGVGWTWLAKSLPWGMPEEAFIGVQVAGMDERFNRERLQVLGLREGDYELRMGGEALQSFTAEQLRRGVELHPLWNRPGYRRAQGIAARNAKRHADTVRPMRELWQRLAEVRRNHPGDAERERQTAAEIAPELSALRQAAREEADAIYAAARPEAIRCELRRILTPEERKAAEKAGTP
jgi:lysophospholipase L1-like esterase